MQLQYMMMTGNGMAASSAARVDVSRLLGTSATPGHQVRLTAGNGYGIIHLIVSAEGPVGDAGAANTKVYTVTIYRENLPLSDNALLAARPLPRRLV